MIKSWIKTHRQSKKPVTHKDMNRLYQKHPNLSDYLPVIDYKDGRFILEDGISTGVFFEIQPVATEVLSEAEKEHIETNVLDSLTLSIPRLDNPYVLQAFIYDEPSLDEAYQQLEGYIKEKHPTLKAHQIEFLEDMKRHYRNVSKPCGYFDDKEVSGTAWGGKKRHMVGCLYRRINDRKEALDPEKIDWELEEAFSQLTAQLSEAQITLKRYQALDFFRFNLVWFNPDLDLDTLNAVADIEPGNLPFGQDLSTLCMLSQPVSDHTQGTWEFGGKYMKALSGNGLRRVPKAFHLTGERSIANKRLAMFDRLPSGTRMSLSITFTPEDTVENHLTRIKEHAKGDTADATLAIEEVNAALLQMKNNDALFPLQLVFYVQGDNKFMLAKHISQTRSALLSAGIQLVDEKSELAPLHTFIKSLPFNFEPSREKDLALSRYTFASHLVRLLPLYSRQRGSGNPGWSCFNRGGEVFSVDILSKADRVNNAFMVIFGAPGSGKSATVLAQILQAIVVHNARVFIIEKGRSFKLLCQQLQQKGLTWHEITLSKNRDISMPPFADALRMIAEEVANEESDLAELRQEKSNPKFAEKLNSLVTDEEIYSDEDDDQRDFLGEMELIARVMITGGEKKEEERMIRADRLMIRNAILEAAQQKYEAQAETLLTQDVVNALLAIGKDTTIPEARQQRALEMADAMALFCSGMEGHFFNRPGQPMPEADIVSMEIGALAREGYEHQLTVAFMSMMNKINSIVERDQYQKRPTIVLCDEAHIVTTNPLLSPYIVKIVKMWRKLGAWLWLATQNLEDFPDASAKMLSMFEHWLLMNCSPEEVAHASRFLTLTDEDKQMIIHSKKESGKYTEGVYISKKIKALIRLVPTPQLLALAQTEKDEKAARAELMREMGLSELEAAMKIGEQIEGNRGERHV